MGFNSGFKALNKLRQIWRSWHRASWYISIVEPTICTIFEFIEYHSTCFGRSFCPSSGVPRLYIQHQVYVIQVSWLLASKQSTNQYDIYLMLCLQSWKSWWWTERPSETCRVIFNKLENCVSSWFYYRNTHTPINECTNTVFKVFKKPKVVNQHMP